MQATVRIIVSGLVQGVGYRYFCKMKADEFNVRGYAKNLPNSNVEIVAAGEKTMINDFIKSLKVGPLHAIVNNLIVEDLPMDVEYTDFKTY